MRMKSKDVMVTVRGTLVRETEKAIQLKIPNQYKHTWFPLSTIHDRTQKLNKESTEIYVEILVPEWIIKAKIKSGEMTAGKMADRTAADLELPERQMDSDNAGLSDDDNYFRGEPHD